MGMVMGMLGKYVFTEAIIRSIVIALGDHLVKSSKNKLDDVLWAKVKKAIAKG